MEVTFAEVDEARYYILWYESKRLEGYPFSAWDDERYEAAKRQIAPPLSQREILLAAIRAVPEDDAPRLVYADWLDENAGEMQCPHCCGKGYELKMGVKHWRMICGVCDGRKEVPNGFAERAEFIRVQIALSNMHTEEDCGCADCRKRSELRKRSDELESRYGEIWLIKG